MSNERLIGTPTKATMRFVPLRELPPDSPATMRAAVIVAFGGPDALQVRSVPVPQLAAGEVLVRVDAAGINPIDWATRAGGGVPVPAFPAVLGWDLSGLVAAVGSRARRFTPGDQVFGLSRFPKPGGAYAEYAAVPEEELATRPPHLDPITAGSSPMVALTAWSSLYELAGLAAGQRVLIHGAAGGVGHVAVQLAKLRGADVLATASPRNHQFLIGLGADQVIDYTTDWIGSAARDLDVILDPIGGPAAADLLRALRPGGTLVTLKGADPRHDAAARDRYNVARTYVAPDGPTLAQIGRLLADGSLRVHVAETFSLDEIGRAHAIGEQGHVRGKLVALPGQSS